MSVKSFPALAGAVCACVSGFAFATHHNDEVVVTASRTKQSVDTVLAPVSVFSREDIEASQASNIYQLLKRAPGVQLARNGGAASSTSLYLRGTDSDHTLILIDGVRASSATLGSTALETLNLDQVERIEIVRGPRSSVYGSDAIGGVIQIFTRNPAGSETSITVGAGTDRTRRASLTTSGAYDGGSVTLTASKEQSDGFDAMHADDDVNGDPAIDKDNDDYEMRDASFKWDHSFSEDVRISWSNLYSEDESDYDVNYPGLEPYTESRNAVSSLSLDLGLADNWDVNLKSGYALDSTDNKDHRAPGVSEIETKRFDYSLNNQLKLAKYHEVIFGIDYVEEKVDGSNFSQDERENLGTFAQYLGAFGGLSVSVGARYDDSDTFGHVKTGNVAFGYHFIPEIEVILSHGTAFKAPTFNDLFWPSTMFSEGNPDLRPEESRNTELQLRGDLTPDSSYQFNVFYNEIENLIDWQETDKWRPTNVANARIRGVELAYNIAIDSWDIGFNSSYIEPKDRADDVDLERRARTSGSLDISRTGEGYTMGLTISGTGQRKGDEGEPGGYGTVDIRFERRFSESLLARFKVENLFDREIVLVPNYNDVGRFAMFEVQYKFLH